MICIVDFSKMKHNKPDVDAKRNFRHIHNKSFIVFEPFRVRLASNFANSVNVSGKIQYVCQKNKTRC
jgi:hypothetical protein